MRDILPIEAMQIREGRDDRRAVVIRLAYGVADEVQDGEVGERGSQPLDDFDVIDLVKLAKLVASYLIMT